MVQNDKKFCHAQYLRNYTSYDCHLWYTCVPGVFFRFLGGKRARGKYIPKWQKILSRLVSQEPYIIWLLFMSHLRKMIWLSFMLQLCKMIISPGGFLIFSKFWCSGILWGWKGKKRSKMTKKICLLHCVSQEPYIIWLLFMVHICKMMSSSAFFIFSKFYFLDP